MKETEFCLNSRTIKLPLTVESVLTSTHFDLVIDKDEKGLSIYRELLKDEKEWIFFLKDKALMIMDEAEKQREKELVELEDSTSYSELLYFFDIQIACAMFLLARCGYLLERDMNIKRKNKNLSEEISFTQKAALAKSEKALSAWKPAITAMIQVAVRCGAEGPAPRQKSDFYTLFNEIDAELTDTQMAFFRSSLPEGYSDKDGGKPGKV